MVDLFSEVIRQLDPILVFWAIVLNVAGFYIKRVGLPKSAPPIPLILYLIALVPCLALGWVQVDAEGGKAALGAILYGASNAAMITLPAVFGYDIVHAYTGKMTTKRDYKFVWKDKNLPNIKLKAVVYGVSGFVAAATAGSLAYFLFNERLFYSFCWALLIGATAVVIARTVLHIVFKDESQEMYAISIYCMVSLGAFAGLIFTTSWLWVSILGATMVGFALMALGIRFMDPVAEESTAAPAVPEKKKDKKEKKAEPEKQKKDETDVAFLRRTLRFRLVDDKLGNPADPTKPLCKVGADALTVDEAFAQGVGFVAVEGAAYIDKLLEIQED